MVTRFAGLETIPGNLFPKISINVTNSLGQYIRGANDFVDTIAVHVDVEATNINPSC